MVAMPMSADYQADAGRYRNKLTVKAPWKVTPLQLQPYFSDEVFFSFGGPNVFNQNRVSVGLGMNLGKRVKAEMYFLLQSSKSSGKWSDTNVLGTKLKIAF